MRYSQIVGGNPRVGKGIPVMSSNCSEQNQLLWLWMDSRTAVTCSMKLFLYFMSVMPAPYNQLSCKEYGAWWQCLAPGFEDKANIFTCHIAGLRLRRVQCREKHKVGEEMVTKHGMKGHKSPLQRVKESETSVLTLDIPYLYVPTSSPSEWFFTAARNMVAQKRKKTDIRAYRHVINCYVWLWSYSVLTQDTWRLMA